MVELRYVKRIMQVGNFNREEMVMQYRPTRLNNGEPLPANISYEWRDVPIVEED